MSYSYFICIDKYVETILDFSYSISDKCSHILPGIPTIGYMEGTLADRFFFHTTVDNELITTDQNIFANM